MKQPGEDESFKLLHQNGAPWKYIQKYTTSSEVLLFKYLEITLFQFFFQSLGIDYMYIIKYNCNLQL